MGFPRDDLFRYVEQEFERAWRNHIHKIKTKNARNLLRRQDFYTIAFHHGTRLLDVVQRIVSGFLIASEETQTGNWRESLLAEAARQSGNWKDVQQTGESKQINGQKVRGVDLCLLRPNAVFLLQIKSGPHGFNSTSREGQTSNMKKAIPIAEKEFGCRAIPILFATVGADKSKQGEDPADAMQGQLGWSFATGDKELYKDVAVKINVEFLKRASSTERANAVDTLKNRLIECLREIGTVMVGGEEHIDLGKVLEFTSGNLLPKFPHHHRNFLRNVTENLFSIGERVTISDAELEEHLGLLALEDGWKSDEYTITGYNEGFLSFSSNGVDFSVPPWAVQRVNTKPLPPPPPPPAESGCALEQLGFFKLGLQTPPME